MSDNISPDKVKSFMTMSSDLIEVFGIIQYWVEFTMMLYFYSTDVYDGFSPFKKRGTILIF